MNRGDHERAPEDRVPACGAGEHAGSLGEAAFGNASFERASRMLRAAGDASRLRLLEMLSRGEVCVTEIAAATGEGLSTVSQRLRLLRGEGLVGGRRVGRHVYYALSDQHVAELLLSVLDHAAELESAPLARTSQDSKEPILGGSGMTEKRHEGHEHTHGEGCGHTAVNHDGHTDYLHDGHLHHQQEDGAVEEHAIAVDDTNPDAHTPDHEAEHSADHEHGPGCGHEPVPHGDHTDYLVEEHLHHPHGDHCDNHGPVEVLSR